MKVVIEHFRKLLKDGVFIDEQNVRSLPIGKRCVYFEVGFTKGLGIPVIWTCREDDFDDLLFDTKQYNHI